LDDVQGENAIWSAKSREGEKGEESEILANWIQTPEAQARTTDVKTLVGFCM